VTPDRPDHTPDDAELGVLSDTGSIDTTRLDILGGATAQVSVELPAPAEDDFVDDDVVGDEVPIAIETFSAVDVPTETAEGEIVEMDAPDGAAHEWADDAETAEAPAGATDDVEDADVIVDEDPAETPEHDEPGAYSTDSSSPYDDMIAGAAAAAAATEPEPLTGPTPATRREAYHPETRIQAVERVQAPPAEVTLASKRFGEIENRETADLLTADRLLDPHQVVRPEPEGAWQHFVYSISAHRINLGDGKRARERKELDRRISGALNGGARFVPVLSRKGGVGKTTVTTLLGMALADARDDRIIAVDANPDRGTLAERIAKTSGKTVRDLVRLRAEVVGFNDLSSIVARDETRLDVLASDADPRVSEAFSDRDYLDVASLAAHYYSIVLTDTGTGIVHSVMGATLDLADQLVVVSGLSVDEARLASETLTWLETNGYADQVRGAIVVLNAARPGTPLVRPEELESHFNTRVRSVVRIPYDPHIAAGSAIGFRDLRPATRLAARELAASVVEGLRSLARAA
jgi:MinD-like ATPase involved in chromosome partitioning or flagellar assembly